ncbi:hypothetical protein D3C85_1111600 [compost metagenome]
MKNPVKIAKVGPTTMMNTSSSNARPILICDSILTPLSKPASTDQRAIMVIPTISTTLLRFVDSIPKRYSIPAAACSAPIPSEVASPNNVANTARISIKCPGHPQTRSPSNG